MISPERASGYFRVKGLGLSSMTDSRGAVGVGTKVMVTVLQYGGRKKRLCWPASGRPSISFVSELNTVRGPIDTADIGDTLMHEHVFIMTTEIAQNYPEAWGDEEKRVADAITRLNELKARGVDTIVDLTVIGLGRYIPRIARVAAATELNIVVATGLYTYNDVPFCFHYMGPGAPMGGPEVMTELFVRDIEQGIADTGIKAGILKCATDEPGLTPGVERALGAVAPVH